MCRHVWWMAGVMLWSVAGWAGAQSVNMGQTFHDLEARAERVVTTFPDAEIVTQRESDGRWRATLRDRQGRARAELHGDRGQRAVGFRTTGRAAEAVTFEIPEGTDVSLDWSATQVYALWHDHAALAREGRTFDPSSARWDGHVRRDGSAMERGQSVAQLLARVQRVTTDFPGITVTAAIDEHRRVPEARRVDYSKFTARVVDRATGRDKGFIRWFDTAQALTWKIEGGGEGVVLADRLREGWTFTPTMAWAAVQAYYCATRPAPGSAEGALVRLRDMFRKPAADPPLGQVAWLGSFPGLSRTLPWSSSLASAGLGAPAPALNEPGCDNLHWLDHTIFRLCCDRHDVCYETYGCTASSWRWPFSGSWQCAACNIGAVWCFCTAANPVWCSGGAGGGGGSGGGSVDCSSASGGFCPVECQTCIAS
jgi:hypothetical protein